MMGVVETRLFQRGSLDRQNASRGREMREDHLAHFGSLEQACSLFMPGVFQGKDERIVG